MRKNPDLSLRARALRHLARREYSRAELRSKLLRYAITDATNREFDAEVNSGQAKPVDLEALLDDLTARGWLSDQRAATQLVHSKRSRFGTQRITHELRQKGIPENLIESALPVLQETELEIVREVWKKKFGMLPKDMKEQARQMRFLQSRGFSLNVILKLLRSAG